MKTPAHWLVLGVVMLGTAPSASGNEPVTLENVKRPAPNRADEPMAKSFSLEAATRFLS